MSEVFVCSYDGNYSALVGVIVKETPKMVHIKTAHSNHPWHRQKSTIYWRGTEWECKAMEAQIASAIAESSERKRKAEFWLREKLQSLREG